MGLYLDADRKGLKHAVKRARHQEPRTDLLQLGNDCQELTRTRRTIYNSGGRIW